MFEIIKSLKNKKIEYIYVFDNEQFVVFFEGDRISVEIENKFLIYSSNISLIHNHPNGTPFSVSDITNLISFNIKEMILVTKNFIYHVFRPVNGWNINIYSIENELLTYDSWANEEIDKLVLKNILTFEEAHAEKNHYIWIVFFQNYNIKYFRKSYDDYIQQNNIR